MRYPRVIAYIEPRPRQPASQVVEIVDPGGARQRRIVDARAPMHRHRSLQTRGKRTELLERPVLTRAAREGMNHREVLPRDIAANPRDPVRIARRNGPSLLEVKGGRVSGAI